MKVDQAWDSQTSKYIRRTDTIMDKEKEVNSNQESSNKSQAVVEWLLGELIPNNSENEWTVQHMAMHGGFPGEWSAAIKNNMKICRLCTFLKRIMVSA